MVSLQCIHQAIQEKSLLLDWTTSTGESLSLSSLLSQNTLSSYDKFASHHCYFCMLAYSSIIGGVYKLWWLNIIEVINILNLSIL